MNFSALIVPINNRVKGIIKLEILKSYESLILSVNFYKILFSSSDECLQDSIMDSLFESCKRDPTNSSNIFNSISTELIVSKKFNYSQLEDLSEKFNFINGNTDLDKKFALPCGVFGPAAILTVRDIKRMQRYVDSLLFNFNILNDTFRFTNKIESKIKNEKSDDNLFQKEVSPVSIISEEKENIEVTLIDHIFNFLSLDTQCIGYLIDLIYNYYRYYNDSSISISTDNVLCVESSNLFSNVISFNKPLLLNIFESINTTSLDKSNLIVKNCIKFIENNKDNLENIHIKSLLFILLLYSLRHLNENYKLWYLNNIDSIVRDVKIQEKILNTYCNKISDISVSFKINNNSNDNFLDDNNLEEISKKYEYIKNIDQYKFITSVFSEFKQNDFIVAAPNLGSKVILNVEDLLNHEEKETELINSKLPKMKNYLLAFNRNTKNPKIITELFYHFLQFLNNPVYITMLPKKKFPINIIKSFDVLKEILNDINFKKENNQTYNYYLILKNYFPEDFSYSNYLLIIYQIIIPHMYYYHKLIFFEDSFLNLYKIE